MPFLGERAGVVELRLPARPGLIATARAVAADVAARAGFDLDAISDLRMAVDEAAATMLALAGEETPMHCRFIIGSDHIEATVSAQASAHPAMPDTTGFGWRVMQALVDEIHVHGEAPLGRPTPAGRPAPHVWVGIRMIKKRTADTAGAGDPPS